MFKLCVLTRWDFNFCVCSSPLRVEATIIPPKSPQKYHKGVCKILTQKHIASVTVLGEAKSDPSAYYIVIVGICFVWGFFLFFSIAFICGNLEFLTRAVVKTLVTRFFHFNKIITMISWIKWTTATNTNTHKALCVMPVLQFDNDVYHGVR